MKYYETLYEEYINSCDKFNIHPELDKCINKLPSTINKLPNLLVYGPSGIGKYTQVLRIIKKYSPSELKYDKRIIASTEKQDYNYHISDIHYEIDMSLLGCNAKSMWHEIFFQIVDIITVKPNKVGIIVCKNFHMINSELLEIFYSYMQQYNTDQSIITIKFIIVSEHISFIPHKVLNSCYKMGIKRPSRDSYMKVLEIVNETTKHKINVTNNISNAKKILDSIELYGITNIKELRSFMSVDGVDSLPEELFNRVCNNVIDKIEHIEEIPFTAFRDTLYELLTYNIDINECIWYTLYYFISDNRLDSADASDILIKSYTFFKYFNNNYRPIYHLENIMFYIIKKIYNYDELPKSMQTITC